MPFAIVADLPLGTYHGAGQDGQPEPVPSMARLHAALLCAAGFGPRAVSTGPDSPERSRHSSFPAISFRRAGSIRPPSSFWSCIPILMSTRPVWFLIS